MSLLKFNKLFRNQNQKGFSLVELMIAVGILSAVSFGIFQSFQVGFWGMSDARARTIATNLAQEKLEEVKGKALVNGKFPDPDNPIKLSGKDFDVVIDVADAEESYPPLSILKRIVTTVSWQKRDGTDTEIKVEGLQSRTEFFKDAPFAILLSIDPKEITIGENALITVTILDQDNYPIPFKGIIELTMDPETLGTLDGDSYLQFDGDTSYLQTHFNANTEGDAGSVVITAKDIYDELIPDSEMINITGGEPKKINLEVEQDTILINGEKTLITIEIEDENGYLAENWTGEIELEIVSGTETGYLGENPSPGNKITVEFNEENTKTVSFTSSEQEGEAIIKATDKGGKLEDDEATINVNSGPPFKILVKADPNNVMIEGTSDITITILNETGIPVSGFEGTINLTLQSGSAIGSVAKSEFIFRGEKSLTTTFTAKTVPGVVVIEAKDKAWVNPLQTGTETITVATGPPSKIEIDAIPKMILNDGTEISNITITLKDSGGNQSSFDDDKDMSFSISPNKGTLNSTMLTLPAGQSSNAGIPVTYFCNDKNFDGDVQISVSCPGIGEASVTVQVVSRILKPTTNPNIRYGRRNWGWGGGTTTDQTKILFEIEVVGGTINVFQIDLAWKGGNTRERIRGITVYDKNNSNNVRIRKTWSPSNNYQLVKVYSPPVNMDMLEIKSFDTLQNLTVREYTVELQFDQSVTNRTILIQFHGKYDNKTYIYEMEFLSPDIIV